MVVTEKKAKGSHLNGSSRRYLGCYDGAREFSDTLSDGPLRNCAAGARATRKNQDRDYDPATAVSGLTDKIWLGR